MGAVREFLNQFRSREHTPLVQFIKYGIAGVIATLVHTVIFFFCSWQFLPALGSNDPLALLFHVDMPEVADAIRARNATWNNLIAFFFSNLTAYLINIKWVFEGGRHHRLVEIGMFYAVSGLSLVTGTFLQWILIHYHSWPTSFAFGINILVSLLINYGLRKFVVFKG